MLGVVDVCILLIGKQTDVFLILPFFLNRSDCLFHSWKILFDSFFPIFSNVTKMSETNILTMEKNPHTCLKKEKI